MPYTTEQISAQEIVVLDLDEKIKWINDTSHHFTGGRVCPQTDSAMTRTQYWAAWRTANPNAVTANPVYGVVPEGMDNAGTWTITSTDTSAANSTIMWDYWQHDMVYDIGYEQADWSSTVTSLQSDLTDAQTLLTTMQNDPA